MEGNGIAIDGDGKPDVVLANRDGQPNAIYLKGAKKEAIVYGTGSDNTRSVALVRHEWGWALGYYRGVNRVFRRILSQDPKLQEPVE